MSSSNISKPLTLSIVIPVYNEEHHLGACLKSIKAQTVMPDEVIVVDNNSTDRTAAVATSYHFVRLLSETKQHQVFAQGRGFDMASSDLIGRIDADTILPADWVEQVRARFQTYPNTLAISGGGVPYDVPLQKIGTWIFRTYHELLAQRLAGHPMLWGSNMVLRASIWPKLRRTMHFRPDLWEDYDMSFHLARMGHIRYEDDLKVSCSFRAAHKSLVYQLRYQLRAVRTFYVHTSLLRTVCFALAWSSLLLLYPFPFIDRYLWRLRQYRQG